MYVRTYVCMYVCMYVCVCIYIYMYLMYLCIYVCLYVCTYLCMYVCMYLCVYLCGYVCVNDSFYLAPSLSKRTCVVSQSTTQSGQPSMARSFDVKPSRNGINLLVYACTHAWILCLHVDMNVCVSICMFWVCDFVCVRVRISIFVYTYIFVALCMCTDTIQNKHVTKHT
jgi:hypothetical protein